MANDESYFEIYDDKVINYPALNVNIDHQRVILVYDASLRANLKTKGCIFVDENALSNAPYRYPRNQRICFLMESPTRGMASHIKQLKKTFDLVLTFDQELVNLGAPFKKFLYGTSWINAGRPIENANYAKDKLCSFVGSIEHKSEFGYVFRKDVAQWAIKQINVDAWGKGIKPFDTKDDVLSPYQFSISMENTQKNYYFTEKLIDCFVSNTVPIYWGCDSIGDIFDERGVLMFNSIEELSLIMDKLSPELYEKMCPYVLKNKEIAFDMSLTGHETLCKRLAKESIDFIGQQKAVSTKLSRSKPLALIRKIRNL